MNCDGARAALLERARFSEAEGHLAGCAECASFSKSLSAAGRLRGVTPSAPRPARARVVARGAVLLVGLALGGAALSRRDAPPEAPALAETEGPPEVVLPEAAAVLEPVDAASSSDAQAQWRALVALRDAVAFEARRDVRVVDGAYVSFGALPAWVAPAAPRPMRSLGVNVPSLGLTTEE